ncbi:hypothetical protein ACFO0R_09590, partial [Chromobacterium aquaticum]
MIPNIFPAAAAKVAAVWHHTSSGFFLGNAGRGSRKLEPAAGGLRRGVLEPVYDLFVSDNELVKRKSYPSDISREKFAQIEPLLRGVRRN